MYTKNSHKPSSSQESLEENFSSLWRGWLSGTQSFFRKLFSFQSLKLPLVLMAVLGIGAILFSFGVFGDVNLGISLRTNSDLESGLIGYWTLNGPDFDASLTSAEVRDVSGQGNHGNYIGGGTGLNTGTGGDGSVSFSSSQNINTDVLGSNRSTNADGILTTVDANPTGTSISVLSTTGITAGDEILLINLQGADGDVDDVGNYEFLIVDSVSGGDTINTTTAVQNSYDGTTFSSQSVVVQRVPQWTSVTISSPGVLTANDWDGSSGGVIVFRATETVTVSSGGSIDADDLGYQGGAAGVTDGGDNGESYDGFVGTGGDDVTSGGGGGNAGTDGGGGSSNTTAVSPSGTRGGGGGGGNVDGNSNSDGAGGGGGGGYGAGGGGGAGGGDDNATGGAGGAGGTVADTSGGGGGGGVNGGTGGAGGAAGSGGAGDDPDTTAGASSNNTGQGGSSGSGAANFTGIGAGGAGGGGSYGAADLSTIFLGSGGGGGGGSDFGGGEAGGVGGDAGGIIMIIADTVTVSGGITNDGENGADVSLEGGSSGGGSGGSIFIQANSVTLGSSLVTATGGSGGSGSTDNGGGGGGGGIGRIRVEATTRSGTTNPAASETDTPTSDPALFEAGASGQALILDGTDDYINVGNIGSGIQTIAFWIKADDATSREIINIDGSDEIELNGSSNVIATNFPAATVYVDGSSASANIPDSDWHHVVVTDTSGVSASTFEIGRGATPTYFDGTMDDVRAYTKVLTPEQITRLYELGLTSHPATTITVNPELDNGLISHWTFDGEDYDISASSAEVLDSSGNGNHGDAIGLAESGGTISTTTDSFENVADGSVDFLSTNLWKQATISSDTGDWQAESANTGSNNTGADDGFDGDDFIYTEGSNNQQCDTQGDSATCTIEADIADGVSGAIQFAWNLDGADIGTLTLDAYNGASWTTLWTRTGDQGVGATWQESYVEWDASDNYTALRFQHVAGTSSFESDASLDYIRVGTSTPLIPGSIPSPRPGSLGQALDLNGTEDYINVGDIGSGIKTVTFWIKADDITGREIINLDGSVHIEINGSSQILATNFPAATVYIDGVTGSTIDSEWHHVVVTDTTGVDGSTFQIGRVGSEYFDGKIDDVRVYNRVLSQDEITRLYHTGATTNIGVTINTNPALQKNLVGHWSFDGSTVTTYTTIGDTSGQGNNGTFVGDQDSFSDVSDWGADINSTTKFPSDGEDGAGYFSAVELRTANKFTISSLPVNATVTQVDFSIEQTGVTGDISTQEYAIGPYNGDGKADPQADAAATAFSRSDVSSDNYISGDTSLRTAGIKSFTDLGAQAEADVFNARRAGTTFSLAIKETTGNGSGGSNLSTLSEFDEANPPTITITYEERPTTAIGKIGQALEFDGVDDYVNAGSDTSLDVSTGTVALWFWTDNIPSGDDVMIAKDGSGTNTGDFSLGIEDTAHRITYVLDDSVPSVKKIFSNSAIDFGEWTHVAVTFGSGGMKMYVNGVLQSNTNASNTTGLNASADLILAARRPGLDHFNGILDDVRVYNRELTSAEVLKLYQLGSQ